MAYTDFKQINKKCAEKTLNRFVGLIMPGVNCTKIFSCIFLVEFSFHKIVIIRFVNIKQETGLSGQWGNRAVSFLTESLASVLRICEVHLSFFF